MKVHYVAVIGVTFLAITSFIAKSVLVDVPPTRKKTASAPVCSTGICKVPSRAAALRAGASTKLAVAYSGPSTDMVLIKGGSFQMGSADFPDAKPVHAVSVNSFWMDTHEVTNAEFEKFVNATRYVTVAERPLNPKDYPGVPADKLVPGSAVFTPPVQPVSLANPLAWWQYVYVFHRRKRIGKRTADPKKDGISPSMQHRNLQSAVAGSRITGRCLH